MTIAIDVRSLAEKTGGVPAYTRNLLKALLARNDGHRYVIFTSGYHIATSMILRDIETVALRCSNKLLNGLIAVTGLPNFDYLIEKKIGRHVDLFFVPNLNFFSCSPSTKVVVTAHDIAFHLFPHLLSPKHRRWHTLASPQRFFNRADRIIAVSDHTKRDVMDVFSVSSEKIDVVFEGITPPLPSLPTPDSQIAPPEYFLMMGVDGERKNASLALKAYARALLYEKEVSRYPLILVGSKTTKKKLAECVKSLALEHCVLWLHDVSEGEKVYLYEHARALLYPSLYEGFGFPPFEAMKYDVPAIVAANSALSELFGSRAIMVDSNDAASLADALMLLAGSDRIRAHYGEGGRAYASRFTWEKAAEMTVKVFEKAVM